MSNELQLETNPPDTGAAFYVVFWNTAGQAWNGSAYATYTTTRDTWDVPATETPSGTGRYILSVPSGLPAGYTRWSWFKQAGGSPSHSNDVRYSTDADFWFGARLLGQVPALEGHTYYIAASGGSDNNAGTYNSPLANFSTAQTRAVAGDTIFAKNGTYSPVTISKSGVTLVGESMTGTVFESPSAACIIVSGNDVSIRRISAHVTGSADGSGITVGFDVIGTLIEDCDCIGVKDGLYARGTFYTRIRRTTVTATWDGIMLGGSKGFLVEDCRVFIDGTFPDATSGMHCIVALGGAVGTVRNTEGQFWATAPVSGTYIAGITVGPSPDGENPEDGAKPAVVLDNVRFKIHQRDDEATEIAYGIVGDTTTDPLQACIVVVRGGSIDTFHANDPSMAIDIHAPTGSYVALYGTLSDGDKWVGSANIHRCC